ncbi:DNA replication terminus site-binding protein [Alkalimonas collagenimarina]|uniref:DNA replication terminus site-binding protein n=1 Tax=Alkalimonas collagenimarina TaxID=400390 RepID=UPI003510BB8B
MEILHEDSEYFRTVRPLRITPIVNLKYNRSQNGEFNKTTMIAHSPLIVLNDRPKLSPLKPYTGKRIKDAKAGPLIARLHLYHA